MEKTSPKGYTYDMYIYIQLYANIYNRVVSPIIYRLIEKYDNRLLYI